MTMHARLAACAIAVTGLAMAAPVQASETLLTVSAGERVQQYNLEALQALSSTEFTTSTVWTDGRSTFTGVPLYTLLKEAGIESGSVMATAINDYAVEIPLNEIDENAPIVAYLQDGEIMSARDKGPLWIVYPYDSDADYRTETAYSRSIWQLDRILGAE